MNKTLIVAALLSVFAASSFAQAPAATAVEKRAEWQKSHPRRVEVNARLANQNRRIHNEVKAGEITKAQAAGLHKEDRQIRHEEQAMASQNGGHITKLEKRTLNQQENKVSAQIGK